MKSTMVWIVYVTSDLPETQLANASEGTLPQNVDRMKNMTTSTKCVSADKITIESTVNAKYQLLVVPTHTGTVLGASARLDLFSKTADAFSLPTQSQCALQMPDSMELLVFVKLDSTKSQDTFVKDALMAKFGTVLNAIGTPLVQMALSGMLNTEDAILELSNALKMLNGMVLCVFAIQVITWLVLFVLNVHQTLLGMEEIATPKFQLALVVRTKFSSTENVFARTVSTWSRMFV